MNALLTGIRRRLRPNARANCREVAVFLQRYLDGEVDEYTLRRVAAHLEDCRRCGLEAATYRSLKRALARRGLVPADAAARLRTFAEQLVAGGTDA
jgi:anti-sigma factor RsiW